VTKLDPTAAAWDDMRKAVFDFLRVKGVALADVAEILKGEVEAAREDLQEEFDAKSEKWQEGEKGEAMQERIDAWEVACATADTLIEEILYAEKKP
jgi:hypothetical protein